MRSVAGRCDTVRGVTVDEDALRRVAARARELADEADAAGLHDEADALRKAADETDRKRAMRGRLPTGNRSGISDDMVPAERVRHSQGTGKNRDQLVKACNARHLTLRSLTEQLKSEGFRVSHSLLSQARSGDKPIRRELAERIATLTGFAATPKNWPGGWVE